MRILMDSVAESSTCLKMSGRRSFLSAMITLRILARGIEVAFQLLVVRLELAMQLVGGDDLTWTVGGHLAELRVVTGIAAWDVDVMSQSKGGHR